MGLEVELDIFSGVPNPRWNLTQAEVRDFVALAEVGEVPAVPVDMSPEGLGYRGMVVRATGNVQQALAAANLPAVFRVSRDIAGGSDVSEMLLLNSEESGVVAPEPRSAAELAVSGETGLSLPNIFGSETSQAACTPYLTSSTNYDFWNAAAYKPLNNCYNYCSSYRTNTFAQPGRGTGNQFKSLTVQGIQDGMISDGYKGSCAGNDAVVALVIWANVDYHFYKRTADLNSTYCWSHKPGQTSAKRTDNSGKQITDPYYCNRGNYTTWGGYSWSPGGARTTIS